ncbi:MAG: PAS domain S-box protein [Nodosilinea sp.]
MLDRAKGIFPRRLTRRSQRLSLPLQAVLIGLMVLQICLPVGLVGWLSMRNSGQAVKTLVHQLHQEVTGQIANHLDGYLNMPHQLNQINLDAVALGLLKLDDFDRLGQYFWKQMQVFEVGYLNYANEQGEFIGVERLDDGALLINETRQDDLDHMSMYTTDSQGNRLRAEVIAAPELAQTEDWYVVAAEARHPAWSAIYPWDDKPEVLSISLSHPVYAADQTLLGVIGVDLILAQIGDFLKSLHVSPSSRIFIVERSGDLVATSGEEQPFTVVSGQAQRLKAADSPDPVVRRTIQLLQEQFGSLQQVEALHRYLGLEQSQYVDVLPWRDDCGLDWLIITTVPITDFTAQIETGTRLSLLLGLAALFSAILAACITARLVTAPLAQLNQAAAAISSGPLEATQSPRNNLPGRFSIQELDRLRGAFDHMARQMQSSFASLERVNGELEQRVQARTLELQQSEEKFAKAFQQSPMAIAISTLEEGRILDANEACFQLLKYAPTEFIGKTSAELGLWTSPQDRAGIVQDIRRHGLARSRELSLRARSGELILAEVSASLISIHGTPRLLFVSQDISDRKRAEAERHQVELALRESEARFRRLADQAPILIWMSDTRGDRTYFNRTWFTFTGLTPAQARGQGWVSTLHPEDAKSVLTVYRAAFSQRQPFTSRYRQRQRSGEYRWLLTKGVPRFTADGQFEGYVGIGVDINEQKQFETQLQASLQEKEVLLKEIHHRVKNNLHVVANLLDLQADYVEDERALAIFADSQSRIQTMALIHEQLYQADNLGQINFGHYIQRLTESLFFSYGEAVAQIRLVLDLQPVPLNLETAIPCGLLINEIITNAVKYAFPEQRTGEIHVEFFQAPDQTLSLKLWDTGIGLQPSRPGANSPQNSSFGWKLIGILARQLKAEMSIESTAGTLFHFIFRELSYKPRV